ncbi:MAG TPA: hypothetical protein VGL72_16760 [Bryobacteraceae bacterium]
MPSSDSGINKPFDRILKSFADEEPELFLRLLGFVPPDAAVDIQPLRPETAPPVVMPDFVAVFRVDPEDPKIAHAEFESRYDQQVPRSMARYGGSLGWQHLIPVESALVMLRPEGVPAEVPEVGHYEFGPTETTHKYRVVRFWEIDPAPVLATGKVKLLPWALVMNTTEEQVRWIGRVVSKDGDEEAVSRFLQLGSLRYDRDTLFEMLGGAKMGLMKAFLDGSSIVREERAEGRAEGRVEEARHALRIVLRAKFPDLEQMAEVDRISSVEKLEALLEAVCRTNDMDFIRREILATADRLH